MYHRLTILLLFCCCMSCRSVYKGLRPLPATETNILDSLLQEADLLKPVIQNKDTFHLQIIYTRIDRDAGNRPVFTDYTFNENPQAYFYPASTVKMPAALLALEKLNELKKPGVDKFATMITDSSYPRQETVLNNTMAQDGRPTVAEYIKEIFLVSDNDAFNRLYEFLGQQYLNERLHNKGYKESEIRHRLEISLTEDQNRHTNAVSFYDTACRLLYYQQPQFSKAPLQLRNNRAGKAFYRDTALIQEPFNFSAKNRLPLADLHLMLRSVIFPEAVPAKQRFNLTAGDYAFLYKYMSARPRESDYPCYDSSQYPDAYCKFLLFGAGKDTIPASIRIFNKIGDAYGFLNDVAYVVDFENKIEFMLSATILCNSDGVFNDDKYDFDTIGFPYMKNLGMLIYNYEKQRPRPHVPDLSKFVIDYGK